ncbi:hypothetical protein D3C76_715100 [compost metagenome]
MGVGQIHYNTPFFLPILEIILGGSVMDGWAKWRYMSNKRDDADLVMRRKYRGEKSLSPKEEVQKSILDMRKIYPEKSDESFAKWYASKYRVKADAVLKFLKEVEKDGTEPGILT